MKHEHGHSMLEKVSPVHSALAGMISTLQLAVEIIDARAPAEQAELVEYWQDKYLAAVQQLDEALVCFKLAARPVLVVAPRRRAFVPTPRQRAYL